MHDGMQYDPIQGRCEPLKVGNSVIFKKDYLLPHSYIRAQYLKLTVAGFLS